MPKITPPLLLALIFTLGLSGCEEKGPAADIGDNIEQVVENQPEPARMENNGVRTEPDPEALEQQKQEFEKAVEEASKEADDRLNEILDNTLIE
ncbi:hypothetical protein C7H85_00435 [Zobellella endophytica]|uniref:Lipoprotein n=1 Tax=Zobellella endophytica TaxID=2116700 RepID=A0A2P7RAU4_9GAMM|nr:hypothetical protein [Zobellella endophytica]PSJ47341.1 hypothetical protein C7H85_00435 [Zobellella endophytica]